MSGTKKPSIEFGICGTLYYDVIDYDGYVVGEFMSINSSRRSDMLSVKQLTFENMHNVADKINSSLHRLYNISKQ